MDINLHDFFQAGIYQWMRGEECLYIGQTYGLLARFSNHRYVRKNLVLPGDILKFTPEPDDDKRIALEKQLIKKLKPTHNQAGQDRYRPVLEPARSRHLKFTPEQSEQLTKRAMEMARQGINVTQIARELGVCPATADRLKHGHRLRYKIHEHFVRKPVLRTESERNRSIRKLRNEGVTLQEIGTRFKMSRQRVHQIVNLPTWNLESSS